MSLWRKDMENFEITINSGDCRKTVRKILKWYSDNFNKNFSYFIKKEEMSYSIYQISIVDKDFLKSSVLGDLRKAGCEVKEI